MEAYITRQKEVQPVINAITEERWTAARVEARRVDEVIDALHSGNSSAAAHILGESAASAESVNAVDEEVLAEGVDLTLEKLAAEKPLFGVPVSVKGCFAVAGSFTLSFYLFDILSSS